MKRLVLTLMVGVSLLTGCNIKDALPWVGVGAMAAVPAVATIYDKVSRVSQKTVLEKIDKAYDEYAHSLSQASNVHSSAIFAIQTNSTLTPKERERALKRADATQRDAVREAHKMFVLRVRTYKGLIASAYGFPQELLQDLSTSEGQAFLGELAKVLPPPFNELALGGTSLGLLALTILGYGGRSRFKNTAVLLGNMVESLKKSGLLDPNKVKEVAGVEAGKSKMRVADLHSFLKRHNIS